MQVNPAFELASPVEGPFIHRPGDGPAVGGYDFEVKKKLPQDNAARFYKLSI